MCNSGGIGHGESGSSGHVGMVMVSVKFALMVVKAML